MAAWFAQVDAADVAGNPVPLQGVSPGRVAASARRILSENALCSVATVAPDARAHVHTAHFCYGDELELYFLSHPSARHSRNLRANSSAAIAVFSSSQPWGGEDEGLQLFGVCTELPEDEAGGAARAYGRRFPAYVDWSKSVDAGSAARAYRFYRFEAREVKLLCEREYGAAVFVRAVVERAIPPAS